MTRTWYDTHSPSDPAAAPAPQAIAFGAILAGGLDGPLSLAGRAASLWSTHADAGGRSRTGTPSARTNTGRR